MRHGMLKIGPATRSKARCRAYLTIMEDRMAEPIIYEPGARFGRWTVIGPGIRRGPGSSKFWRCQCDCGTERSVNGHLLRRGESKSCGCLNLSITIKRLTVHGYAGMRTPEYMAWVNMRQRCLNPKNKRFADYGGRGVSICHEWRSSFSAFLRDVGPRPSARHSIERHDNDGDYRPGNCRWATMSEQQSNTRRNIFYTIQGETLTLAQWSRKLGIRRSTLVGRMADSGWSVEKALTTPVIRRVSNATGATQVALIP